MRTLLYTQTEIMQQQRGEHSGVVLFVVRRCGGLSFFRFHCFFLRCTYSSSIASSSFNSSLQPYVLLFRASFLSVALYCRFAGFLVFFSYFACRGVQQREQQHSFFDTAAALGRLGFWRFSHRAVSPLGSLSCSWLVVCRAAVVGGRQRFPFGFFCLSPCHTPGGCC